MQRLIFLLCLGCLTGACGTDASVNWFAPDAYPQKLSEWGLFRVEGDRLLLAKDVEPYDLNTPLFTDYAQKLRTLYLPPGTAAQYSKDEAFEFPVGTIISKTFYYPKGDQPGLVQASYSPPADPSLNRSELEVLETRLLVRQPDGWDALPYVWHGDDAVLTIAGTLSRLKIRFESGAVEDLPYIVPTRNECAACHATDHTSGEFKPIGLKARHLNRSFTDKTTNQLVAMAESGRLSGLPELSTIPVNATPEGSASLTDKARAYLDVNCGHCHNARGAADTSGLLLDTATLSSRALGICKPPIAAGQGTGGRAYSIVPGQPDKSILIFRMATADPGSRMPELGRSLIHREGVELISDWVASLDGECIESLPGQGA